MLAKPCYNAELIFDEGLADVFSARIAGNIVNEDILGSMEFACKVAGSKLRMFVFVSLFVTSLKHSTILLPNYMLLLQMKFLLVQVKMLG